VKQWIAGLYRVVAYLYMGLFSVSYLNTLLLLLSLLSNLDTSATMAYLNKITLNKHTVLIGSSVVDRVAQAK
jgi:hypothetical protein